MIEKSSTFTDPIIVQAFDNAVANFEKKYNIELSIELETSSNCIKPVIKIYQK